MPRRCIRLKLFWTHTHDRPHLLPDLVDASGSYLGTGVHGTLVFVILNLFHRYSIRWEKEKKIEVLKSMLDAQEEERTRIARELHDDYGVRLTTLKMYLQAAGKDSSTSPEKRHQHSLDVLDSAIRELRNILFNLSPRALKENGLQIALQELTTQVARIRHVDFELNTAAFKSPIRRDAEHSLYRIAQESINNSIKYASPPYDSFVLITF
ncbi:MAG: hypothetical protein HWD58_11735 [Bacteroidota bacterium]|nr:MAG: hypothetical protein HWD58_11735 [Bacteroidota bacterium]